MTLSGQAKLAGVIGWPVAHSLSPALHGHWLTTYGIDGAYVPLAVRPENVTEALRALPHLGFQGANVTVPHKEAALATVDEADDVAKRIGAVNTIIVRDDGSLFGTNTDAFGFWENLMAGAKEVAPPWRAGAGPAVVLGAGGAARAIVAALADGGVPEIRLTNRTQERADQLAADLAGPVTVVPWDGREDALSEATLLVNTTTLGMTGKSPLDLDLKALPQEALVNDIVYAPLMTPLLDDAKRRGNPVVDGLGMLLHQARPGFEAWFGQAPDVTPALRAEMLARLGTNET